MPSYIAIANSEIDPDSPITADLLTKFRDNPLAVFTGDTSVPSQYKLGNTLLSRTATTSGTSITVSGLDLTKYSSLLIVVESISSTGNTQPLQLNNGAGTWYNIGPILSGSNATWSGVMLLSLYDGTYLSVINQTGQAAANTTSMAGKTTYTNTSTSITIGNVTSSFDAGSLAIYGVR